MRKIAPLFVKELKSYFYSPIAFVVLVVFLAFNGLVFFLIMSALNDPRMPREGSAMQLFFGGTIFFYVLLSIVAAVITMRLIAEERKSGTIEVLMTAPITDWDLVLSKFFGAMAFYLFLWLPTLSYVAVLRRYSGIDAGPLCSGYLGVALLGGMCISVGLLCSAVTRNQIIAAISSFVIITALWTLGIFRTFITGTSAQGFFSYINILDHFFESFSKGIIDTRALVYYVSSTVLCLFLTVKIVESHKWR
ncbi:MAG: ABC transporter permease [Candidatus Aureabacteria bacterium]|nr:ABC transporter permease [Candidatus Auribacterota bacterium]